MSISKKFILWMAAILSVITILVAFLYYRLQISEEEQRLVYMGKMTLPIIEQSLHNYMMTKDPVVLERTLADLSSNKSINSLWIVDKEGVIRAATDKSMVGTAISRDHPRCRGCHKTGRSWILLEQDQKLRWGYPVVNKPECHQCHLPSVRYNGMIAIDFDLRDPSNHLKKDIMMGFLIFIPALMIVGFALFFLSKKIVIERLDRMVNEVNRFRGGDYDARILGKGSDEIAKLELGFNEMVETIRTTIREKDELVERAHSSYKDLGESYREYLQLVNSIDGIVWEADARSLQFHFVSEQAERILGYSTALWYTEPGFWKGHIHPDDRERVVFILENELTGKSNHEFEYRMIAADGRTVWLRDSVTVVIENGLPAKLRGVMVDVTDHKRKDDALLESEKRYRTLFEIAGDGILIVDAEKEHVGKIVAANRAAAEMHGYTVEEMSNLYIKDLNTPEAAIESPERFRRALIGDHINFEVTHRRKDGTVFPLEISARLLELRDHKYILAFDRDITERKKYEEDRERSFLELRDALARVSQSQQEWQNTFDSITDLISIHDKDFNIIKANKACLEYFGLTQQEITTRKCFELFHSQTTPEYTCPHKKTLCDRTQASAEVSDSKRGRIIKAMTFPYYSPEGDLIGSIHIARDITEEREKEMRLIMSERLASLGQMAAGIAHEINNPLAAISGCAEGLLDSAGNGQQNPELFAKYMRIIMEEVVRCKNITTNMLSFVRKTASEKKDVIIHDTLDNSLDLLVLQGRLQEVNVIKNYAHELPPVLGNEGELRQAFLAIITNALDAMENKGTLIIDTVCEDNAVTIRFRDSGPGICDDDSDKIFNPFFTTKSDKGGTGLGLSIVKKIIGNHNGDIDVASEPGKGATFTITLPLQ